MALKFNPFTGTFDYTFTTVDGDARYLKLDQTTPQTFTGGSPASDGILQVASGVLSAGYLINDSNLLKSAEFDLRELYAVDESLSISYGQRNLANSSGFTILDWESGYIAAVDDASVLLDFSSYFALDTGGKSSITAFEFSSEGVTQELKVYGYRTGDALRSLEIGVGVDADDTVSFDGVSNYLFDGNLIASALTAPTSGSVNFGSLGLDATIQFADGAGYLSFLFNGGDTTYQMSVDGLELQTGYVHCGALTTTGVTATGDIEILKSDPVLKLTDNGNSRYSYLTRSDTSDTFWLYNRQQYNNGGGNLIPTMTSDTTPSGIAAASSVWDPASTQAYKAMDNNSGTYWASGSAASWWLRYKFAAVQTITGYSITARGASTGVEQAPKDWTFQGSQDASAWTTLDTQTGIVFSGGQTRSYTVTNETQYLYYRLAITKVGNNGTYCSIATFEMSNPTTTADVQLLKHIYSGTAYKMGSLTLGTYSTSSGTENIYEGYIHQFNILGTAKEYISSSGHLMPDNWKHLYGTGNDFAAYYTGTNMVFDPEVATAQIVFNESGADTDFRIEGDTDANTFYLDAGNNRVGIGTSTPIAPLHVIYPYSRTDTTERIVASFGSNDATPSTSSHRLELTAIGHASSQTTRSMNLQTKISDATETGYLNLQADGGNVGIGTKTPDYKLHVATTGTAGLKVQSTDTYFYNRFWDDSGKGWNSINYGTAYASGTVFGVGANGAAVYGNMTAGAFGVGTYTARDFYLGTDNTVRMVITSTGDVKIPADSKKLSFGAGDDASIQFTGTSLDIQSDLITATDELSLRGGTNGIDFLIGATEQMTLTDGKLAPTTDNDIDLGDSTHKFKDIYIDGSVYADNYKSSDGSDGLTGSFEDNNGNMISVKNGLIVSITPP